MAVEILSLVVRSRTFEQRHAWREQFESMRLLYVAGSRAEDRLILSGVTEDIARMSDEERFVAEMDLAVAWNWETGKLVTCRSCR